jgi:aspartyl protease family protein
VLERLFLAYLGEERSKRIKFMRGILPVIAIIAALVMGMTLMFPEQLRGASTNGTLAALIQASMVAVLVGAGLFGSRDEGKIGLGKGLLYGAIWIGIGLFFIAAYSQRDGFARLWAGITGEISPSSAQSFDPQSFDKSVTLQKSDDGHFWARVTINGQVIRMMVDTGASEIALDPADARRVGLNPENLAFNIPVSTAAGPSRAAGVRLKTVSIGPVVRDNVPATVMINTGGVSLLGMGFLGQLSEVSAKGDTLTLRD